MQTAWKDDSTSATQYVTALPGKGGKYYSNRCPKSIQ